MESLPLKLKLRGLWVGLALGELYAAGQLDDPARMEQTFPLPQTRQLCRRTDDWMEAPLAKIQAFLLEERRSRHLLLEVLPLVFLHPAELQELQAHLSTCLDQTDDREAVVDAIAVMQALKELISPSTALPRTLIPKSAVTQDILLPLGDVRLTVQRTNILNPEKPELTMLSAALSGFQNGFRSLPLSWRFKLRMIHWNGKNSEEVLCDLADRCLAQWAGCYTTTRLQEWRGAVIAPLGQLRVR